MGKSFLNVLLKIRDFFEIIIPSITFCICLITFVLQIFCRYVIKNPLSWTIELCSITFTWTVLFGACYAMRTHGHVTFTSLYDIYPPKVKAITKLIGDFMMLVCFVLCIVPTANYIAYMSISKTNVMQINMTYIYAPYMFFLLMNCFYLALDFINDFKAAKNGGKAMEELMHETQVEWKSVIEEAEKEEQQAKGGSK